MKSTRPAGAWIAWLYGPEALGALALCTARRSTVTATGAGAAGGGIAGAAGATDAGAADSGVATAAGSGVVAAAGSTFALWWAQAAIAIAAKGRIRMNGSPFLVRDARFELSLDGRVDG